MSDEINNRKLHEELDELTVLSSVEKQELSAEEYGGVQAEKMEGDDILGQLANIALDSNLQEATKYDVSLKPE
ncbi:MAG: hypothetical protein HQK68_07675, partial [Desulfamplus sp.]|nr:hypothetical protein [Desulfamplus sp.]